MFKGGRKTSLSFGKPNGLYDWFFVFKASASQNNFVVSLNLFFIVSEKGKAAASKCHQMRYGKILFQPPDENPSTLRKCSHFHLSAAYCLMTSWKNNSNLETLRLNFYTSLKFSSSTKRCSKHFSSIVGPNAKHFLIFSILFHFSHRLFNGEEKLFSLASSFPPVSFIWSKSDVS